MRAEAKDAPNRAVKRQVEAILHVEERRHWRHVSVWLFGLALLAVLAIFVMVKFGNHDNDAKTRRNTESSIVMTHTKTHKKTKAHKKAKKSSKSTSQSTSSASSQSSSSVSSQSSVATSSSSSSQPVVSSSQSSSSSRVVSSSSSSAVRSTSRSQQVAVSSSSSVAATTYTIKSGDNLYRIAANNHLTLAKLKQLNGLTEKSMLQPGQTLRLK